ncbi:MAG TPA: glycosyltransferase family 2 protein [Patescibacteria group bacterium]
MYHRHSVSLIFPAYNEAENIQTAVTECKRLRLLDEIIVVDNNSTDGTAQLAKRAGARVVKETRQGYGFALRKGLAVAKGEYIVLAEPDGTFAIQDVKKLLPLLAKYDCVLGTRTNVDFIHPQANMHGLLRLGNVLLAGYQRWVYGLESLTDCGCTFRAFRRQVVKSIAPHLTVGSSHFLPETVALTALLGYRIVEVPVHYLPRIGQSKITGSLRKSIQVGWNMWWLITKTKWRKKEVLTLPS